MSTASDCRRAASGGMNSSSERPRSSWSRHLPHVRIADRFGVQVDLGEAFAHYVEQVGLVRPIQLEDVGTQVFGDVVLIAHQAIHAYVCSSTRLLG